jgi:hypothetical protein
MLDRDHICSAYCLSACSRALLEKLTVHLVEDNIHSFYRTYTHSMYPESLLKVHPRTGYGPEEEYTFINLGARCGGWSTSRPGRLTPGKDPVPIV